MVPNKSSESPLTIPINHHWHLGFSNVNSQSMKILDSDSPKRYMILAVQPSFGDSSSANPFMVDIQHADDLKQNQRVVTSPLSSPSMVDGHWHCRSPAQLAPRWPCACCWAPALCLRPCRPCNSTKCRCGIQWDPGFKDVFRCGNPKSPVGFFVPVKRSHALQCFIVGNSYQLFLPSKVHPFLRWWKSHDQKGERVPVKSSSIETQKCWCSTRQ